MTRRSNCWESGGLRNLPHCSTPAPICEEPLSGDLPVSERRADWLWRARVDDTACALHVEFQLRGKAEMAHRMFVYASRIVAEYGLVPLGVLVYLTETRPIATTPFVSTIPGRKGLRHDFAVVRLWRVDPAPILAGGLSGLLPIVPLMRGATPEQLPQLAERVVELPDIDALQRGDLISVLATFGTLRFPRINIWEWLRRSTMLTELMDELIEDSPFLRQIHEAAAAEGREEGREQGRLNEARVLLREVAQTRFPELPEADLAPIETIASLDRLHSLVRDWYVCQTHRPSVTRSRTHKAHKDRGGSRCSVGRLLSATARQPAQSVRWARGCLWPVPA